jgi:RHS repeat-associated protein
MDGPYSQGYEYDAWGNVTHKYGWGGEVQGGGADQSSDIYYSYTGNRRNGFSYDAAGNLTNDLGQQFTYDVTGQQTAATYTNLQNWYDGDGLRVKRTEDGLYPALFLRSSILGGQVVAEIDYASGSWQWWRGYVYLGSLLAVQQGGVFWMHEDPVTKSKRVTNSTGAIVSTIELDPWGADTNRSSNAAFQPRKFTSYERDANGTDEAMFRRYNRWQSRFDQPDPYEGSYSLTNPQSFNRYAYVQNDPVNFTDPTGLCIDVLTGEWLPCPPVDPSDVVHTYTFEPGSLFGSYFLPASQGGGSFRGFFFGGLLPSPQEPQGPANPRENTQPVPNAKPPCEPNGSADVGVEAILPVFMGPKGGVQLDSKGVYPYFGLAAGTPGKGLAVSGTAGRQMVSPGISVGFSAAFIVGFSYSSGPITQPSFRQALRNGTWQFGGGTPGASANITVVLDSPRFVRRIWPCQ